MGSGAERAGLCEGDVVVEVNGHSVEREYLKEVVRLIMCGGASVQMLVMDRSGFNAARQSALPNDNNAKLQSKTKVKSSNTHTHLSYLKHLYQYCTWVRDISAHVRAAPRQPVPL